MGAQTLLDVDGKPDPALTVKCPQCGAEEGHECKWPDPTKFGRGWALIRSKVPHAGRRAKLREQQFSDERGSQ